MRLLEVELQNFMSVRSTSVVLENQGLLLLQGRNNDAPEFESNGAGKSTIFEAIIYAIYEKSLRGLSPNELVNNEVGRNMIVRLDVEGDDKQLYKIVRYRKHREHKNNSYVFQQGVNITPKSTKDVNKFIEDLFRIDYSTFTNSILFGSGMVKTFTAASDAEKKSILENMLQLDVWPKAQEVAKKRLKKQKELLQETDVKIQKIATSIEEAETTITFLKEKQKEELQDRAETLKRLKKELKELKKETTLEIKKAEKALEAKEKELTMSSADETDEEEALEKYEKTLTLITKKETKLKKSEKSYNKGQARLESLKLEMKRGKTQIKKLLAEKEKIQEGEGSSCPVCKQEITAESIEDSLKHIDTQIDEINKETSEIQTEAKQLLKTLKKLENSLEKDREKLSDKKRVVQEKIYEVKSSIKVREKARKLLSREVDSLKDDLEKLSEGRELKRLKRRIKELEESEDSYSEAITEKRDEIDEKRKRLEEIKEDTKEGRELLKHLEFAVDAFGNSGIKSYLLDSVTPYLNTKANYYLSKLSGNTAEIEFSTQTKLANGEVRDKFEVRVTNTVGGDSYKANSTGEKRRFDLAISLALQDLIMSRSNSKLNLLMYDEIFDGLDAVGCENAIQLLHDIQKNFESIFVITHNDILKSYFDNVLEITKENGQTTTKLL